MKKIIKIFAFIGLVSSAITVQALPYFTAGGSFQTMNVDKVNDHFGYRVGVGYELKIIPMSPVGVTTEFGIRGLGKVTQQSRSVDMGTAYDLMFGARAHLPGLFNVYGNGGVTRVSAGLDGGNGKTGYLPLMRVGVDYQIFTLTSLFFDYTHVFGKSLTINNQNAISELPSMNIVTLGLALRF